MIQGQIKIGIYPEMLFLAFLVLAFLVAIFNTGTWNVIYSNAIYSNAIYSISIFRISCCYFQHFFSVNSSCALSMLCKKKFNKLWGFLTYLRFPRLRESLSVVEESSQTPHSWGWYGGNIVAHDFSQHSLHLPSLLY